MKNKKYAIAIAHPRLGRGGSEKRVLWGIEAIKQDYQVTLITAGEFNLNELNIYYGTSLKPTDFRIRQVPLPFFLRRNSKAAAIRYALYQRFCRSIAYEFDVLISAYGLCDFGVPAMHFIADFSWDEEIRRRYHPVAPGYIHKDNFLRKLYLSIARMLENPSGRNLFAGEDDIIAVSQWVANIMKKKYGVDCPVINSPVPGEFPVVPYHKRQNGFVCLGRIAPEKRIERIIAILKRVRENDTDLHLHVIGEIGDDAYGRKVKKLAGYNSEWVFCEGMLYGKEKIKMLTTHRFGIHACQGDAFPGAVAEMIKAGCTVFVPHDGGQVDMVNHPALIYKNQEDAIIKILDIFANTELQNEVVNYLKIQAENFSIERFQSEFRDSVDEFLERNAQPKKNEFKDS